MSCGTYEDEMAQPNLAREPSMEEILASIRRIIESNDPAAESANLAAPSQAFADEDFDDGSDMDFVAELAANDRGQPLASQEASDTAVPALRAVEPTAAAAPERSLSLADVAARVRAASARQQELASQRPVPLRVPELQAASAETIAAVEQAASRETSSSAQTNKQTAGLDPVEQPVQAPTTPDLRPSLGHFMETARSQPASQPAFADVPEAPAFTAPTSAPASTTPAASATAATPVAPSALTLPTAPEVIAVPEPSIMPAASTKPEAAASPIRPVEQPALQVESPEMPMSDIETPKASAPEAVESPSLPAQMQGMAGLLSDVAGAQVARSFGELADVFDGLERRSVEEMAQEMLRPMLQEWLDDNLPTLVERLVREEIERVARGPRR
jgi:cell pole-organizing protein PopZ